MPAPRVCVLRAPGTNCDVETAYAFDACGGKSDRVHLFRLLENPALLKDYQVLCIPGGFSYGDDIGAGVVFGAQLRGRLGEALRDFMARDTLSLGICNGFQVLLKAGILPGGSTTWPPQGEPAATLTWNQNGKYTAVWVKLQTASTKNVFLTGIDEIELPVAHAEGRIVVRSPETLAQWQSQHQVALQYTGGDPTPGSDLLPYPANPNGSLANIAGLSDPTGRILGLMPHPERFLFATQHPQWTRRRLRGEGQGMQLFRNAIAYFGQA
jgi:phosphoribosylformylglycinamidine synthase I